MVRSTVNLDTTTYVSMLQTLFEIITSEASYLKSLHLVISHFVESVEFDAIHSPAAIVTKRDYKILFSNIVAVWTVSARLVDYKILFSNIIAMWTVSARLVDYKILFSNIVAVWTVSARLVVLSLSPDCFKCVASGFSHNYATLNLRKSQISISFSEQKY